MTCTKTFLKNFSEKLFHKNFFENLFLKNFFTKTFLKNYFFDFSVNLTCSKPKKNLWTTPQVRTFTGPKVGDQKFFGAGGVKKHGFDPNGGRLDPSWALWTPCKNDGQTDKLRL